MKRMLVAVLAALSLLVTGCQSSTESGATKTTRKQLLLVPSEAVNQQSAQAYRQTLVKAQRARRLDTTSPDAKRVLAIAQRLANQVSVFRPDATSWKWEVNTIRSDEVNAFCMPGGKIAVFTGIIQKLNLTDDELAAVIGHEISHALREHSREKVSQQLLQQGAITLVGIATGSQIQQGMAALISQYLFALPYSRTMETESDIMGLELMARAGFNPEAAPNVWRKMAKVQKGAPPQFLSTHPSDQNRIANLEKALPTVKPLYEAAIQNRG